MVGSLSTEPLEEEMCSLQLQDATVFNLTGFDGEHMREVASTQGKAVGRAQARLFRFRVSVLVSVEPNVVAPTLCHSAQFAQKLLVGMGSRNSKAKLRSCVARNDEGHVIARQIGDEERRESCKQEELVGHHQWDRRGDVLWFFAREGVHFLEDRKEGPAEKAEPLAGAEEAADGTWASECLAVPSEASRRTERCIYFNTSLVPSSFVLVVPHLHQHRH